MAVHTLTTQVNALTTRIVALEPLSIAQVTANTFATKEWMHLAQTVPYWTNRPTRLIHRQRRERYELGVQMRLILSHISAATTGDTSPQEYAWQYIPEVVTYFQDIRRTLAPSGYAEINYLDSDGITIACPGGLDRFYNPYLGKTEWVYIDFTMTVPFSLMGT